MQIQNKKQRVFRGVLALLACSFAFTPILFLPNVKAQESTPSQKEIKFSTIADYANRIDLRSFIGKPVRIPITFDDSQKIPGSDLDYLYIYPPQFYKNRKTGKIISFPIKSVFFASGKTISQEKVNFVKEEFENNINLSFKNQDQIFEELKTALRKQTRTKQRSYLDGIFQIFNIVHAEETTSTSTGDDTITDEDIQTLLDSNDPQMKQMLMLLLLNLLMSQKMADAGNVDKQTCLDNGGDWVDEKCDMGGTDRSDDSEKQAACEDSEGTWKTFSSSKSLCLSRCGKTEAKCEGSALSDFEEAEGIIINSGSASDIKGCKCPEGKCANADNECIEDETQSKDDDEDGVENAQDKCPKSSPDGSGQVNMNANSGYMGCTCSQIQAMGGYQQQTTCPPGQCEGPYWTEYMAQPGSCNNGNVTQGQCVANRSSGNQQMAQQCYLQDQQNQANQAAQNQQKQQALQDLMKQLMGGGQGKGQGGQGQGGGKGQGQGQGQGGDCPSCGKGNNNGQFSQEQLKQLDQQQKLAEQKIADDAAAAQKQTTEQYLDTLKGSKADYAPGPHTQDQTQTSKPDSGPVSTNEGKAGAETYQKGSEWTDSGAEGGTPKTGSTETSTTTPGQGSGFEQGQGSGDYASPQQTSPATQTGGTDTTQTTPGQGSGFEQGQGSGDYASPQQTSPPGNQMDLFNQGTSDISSMTEAQQQAFGDAFMQNDPGFWTPSEQAAAMGGFETGVPSAVNPSTPGFNPSGINPSGVNPGASNLPPVQNTPNVGDTNGYNPAATGDMTGSANFGNFSNMSLDQLEQGIQEYMKQGENPDPESAKENKTGTTSGEAGSGMDSSQGSGSGGSSGFGN